MKKKVSLFVMALLSLAALAVNGSDRADAGKGWEQATSIAHDDLLAITSADAQKELSITKSGANPVGTAKDCAGGIPAGLSPLTVVKGITAGTFALQTADGKYLAWYSGDYPTLSDAVYANSSWTITIAEGVATIANAAVPERLLQYDAQGSQFVVTTAAKSALALWKRIPEAVTISPMTGDISASLAKASRGKKVSDITINLKAGSSYTISQPIIAAGSLTVNGNGAFIDASAITGDNAIIKMPSGISVPTEVDEIAFNNVSMKIATRLFYANRSKFWIRKLSVDNCVIAVDGTFKKSIFDCNGGGNVKLLSVNNSTIYANPKVGQNGGFFSSQSSQKPTEFGEGETQTFQITNSTLYNITNGNDMVTLREKDKEYLSFIVRNNIIVNCGKNNQFFKGLAGGSDAKKAQWDVDGNIINWGGADVSTTETAKGTNDEVKNSVRGIVSFKAADDGDFNGEVAVYTAAPETLGDPRWTLAFNKTPKDIVVTLAEGDISKALEAAMKPYDYIGDIRIKLAKDAQVTISQPIVFANSLYIDVPESDILFPASATIDASGLEGPMITTPAETPEEWVVGSVTISDVKVKGLKKALFASAAKNYLYDTFAVMGCVVEQAADATTLDFTKGSVAKDLLISSSTFYAPTATTKSFYSSQGGQKATEYNEGIQQRFAIFGSTMYNLAPSKNFFSHRQSNQKWLVYSVQSNIFVNCGKSGQVIKGINGGQQGTNPTWIVANNIFNFDGEDTSAAETTGDADEPVKGSAAGVMAFNNVETPDFGGVFTLAEGAAKPDAIGDVYHWTVTYNETVTGIEAVKTAEGADLENAVIYNLNGQRIDKAQAKSGVFIVNGKKVVIK